MDVFFIVLWLLLIFNGRASSLPLSQPMQFVSQLQFERDTVVSTLNKHIIYERKLVTTA